MDILSLGEKIKKKRKELNLTLRDLAGTRITPGQISLVESGKSNPSIDLLEYLAGSLDVSIEYLMESEETQAEKVCVYFENIAEAYYLSKDLNLSENYLEKSLYYIDKYSLESNKAYNLFLRGNIYFSKGEFGLAQQMYISANVIFIKTNIYDQIINTFIKLGEIALILNAYDSAYSYLKQAEKTFTDNEIGNDFILGEIYYSLAVVYKKLDNLDGAINYTFLAKEKFRQLDDEEKYAKTLLLLSDEYFVKGDLVNSIKYSKKTIDIFKKLDNLVCLSEIENNLGKLFSEFDNVEESFIHLLKAKDIRIKGNDPQILDTLINICDNYIKLKDVDSARKVMNEMMFYEDVSDDKMVIKNYLLRYRVEILDDNDNAAEKYLMLAYSFAKNKELSHDVAEISILLGKFHLGNGQQENAAKYLNEGIENYKKLGIIKDF